MASKMQHIIEVITRGAGKSEKQIKGVGGALGGLAKQAGIAAAAYFGTTALLNGIKSSIDLFAKQELAEKKLRFAAGASTSELIKQAEALQKTTRFGDEAIIAQQAYVKSLGISTEQTKEIIAASVDLASAMNISLESAVMNTTKTLSGMQGELGEKLPAAFKLLTAEQLKAGEGIVFIREQFKGFSEEETNTLTGSLDQMSNAIGDVGEVMGEALEPLMKSFAKATKGAAEAIGEFIKQRNETKLEGFIREMQDLGIETDKYELSLKRIELTNAMKNLKSDLVVSGDAQDELNEKLDRYRVVLQEGADLEVQRAEHREEHGRWSLNQAGRELTNLEDKNIKEREVLESSIELLSEQVRIQTELNKLKIEEQQLEEGIKAKNKDKNKEATKAEKEKQKLQQKGIEFLKNQKLEALEKQFESNQIEAINTAWDMAGKAYSYGVATGGPLLGALYGGLALSTGLAYAKNIKKAQYGADFIADSPQLMLVGEGSGPEHVQVTPLAGGDPNLNGPQGGGVTINIQGSVIGTEEFTEEILMPQIKEGLRLGNSI